MWPEIICGLFCLNFFKGKIFVIIICMEKIKVESCSFGIVWVIGWLFTVGFLKLSFLKGALAIIIWPFYLGNYFSVFLR